MPRNGGNESRVLSRTPLSVVSDPFPVFRSLRYSAIAYRFMVVSLRSRIPERRPDRTLSVIKF
jgi:hypothetical protein